jgi:hypothetical protein
LFTAAGLLPAFFRWLLVDARPFHRIIYFGIVNGLFNTYDVIYS